MAGQNFTKANPDLLRSTDYLKPAPDSGGMIIQKVNLSNQYNRSKNTSDTITAKGVRYNSSDGKVNNGFPQISQNIQSKLHRQAVIFRKPTNMTATDQDDDNLHALASPKIQPKYSIMDPRFRVESPHKSQHNHSLGSQNNRAIMTTYEYKNSF